MYKPIHRRENRNPQIRIFECPVCGKRTHAPKYMAAKTNIGHVKTMYCWGCKEERDLIQIEGGAYGGVFKEVL